MLLSKKLRDLTISNHNRKFTGRMQTNRISRACRWTVGALLFCAHLQAAVEWPGPTFNVQLPRIPKYTVDIRQFGGIPDGKTTNTAAIQAAIDHVAKRGGGVVKVPAGIWLTGPIQLRSKVNLFLEEGALVVFVPKYELYPQVKINLNGVVQKITHPPIFGDGLTDVAITGRGIIDGSGHAWRPVKKSKTTERQWRELVGSGGKVLDGKDPIWLPATEVEAERRPVLLKLVNCNRLLLEGVTFQNSPNWNLNPTACTNVTLRNVTVRNPWYSQNGDGLDLEHCRNVIVENCSFDVGDDAICLKSGKDEEGRAIALPTENVLIRNCTVYHGHGGVTIGSEMSSGVRNVWVDNCTFVGTDMGLRFKSQRGRGGVVEKIYIRNVRMIDIPTDAIGMDLFYGGRAPTDAAEGGATQAQVKFDETTPVFREIYFDNIVCLGARRAIAIRGLPEAPVSNIVFRNIYITSTKGVELENANQITLQGVEVQTRTHPVYFLLDSPSISIIRPVWEQGLTPKVRVSGEKSSLSIRGIIGSHNDVELTNNAKPDSILIQP